MVRIGSDSRSGLTIVHDCCCGSASTGDRKTTSAIGVIRCDVCIRRVELSSGLRVDHTGSSWTGRGYMYCHLTGLLFAALFIKMSGQWEVVSKAKKKNGLKTKNDMKKILENGPKVEESLPLSQVQTLAISKDLKETKKPGKENVKKSQKKHQAKKKDPMKDKQIIPKTIETAVKLINKKELCLELEMGQAKFPDNPLVWLKGLVGFLNTRLTVENVHPVFDGKSHEYPQSLLPGDLRDVLKRYVLEVNESVSQALFEWCLTAMANDLSRGDKTIEGVLGYKLITQILAFNNPSLVVSTVSKVKTLLASYHNRQSIGLSLLWIMGQGGYRDFSIGLKVWQEVMLPLVELRLYSAYVVSYLHRLLGLQPGSKNVRADDILRTLQVLCSPPDTVPSNKRKEFQEMSCKLLTCIMEMPYESAFLPLFPSLIELLNDSSPARIQRELESALLAGLLADTKVSKAWLDAYPRFIPQSRLLLTHVGKSWRKVPRTMYNPLKKMLVGFQSVNHAMENKGLLNAHSQACERLSLELLRRMATARASSGFPWRFANFLLSTAIAALLVYDVRRHGSLRASSTGRLLNDLGALPYVEKGWSQTQLYSHLSVRWLQKNGPEYYHKACEISRPYLSKAEEFLITGSSYALIGCKRVYAYAEETAPLISEWIEQWAPGLRDRTMEIGIQVWEQGKMYGIAGGKALIGYGQEAITWAQTNVFIGSWSPDNLQQYSLAVLNATQQYALGTYDWLYQKVQTYSKVE